MMSTQEIQDALLALIKTAYLETEAGQIKWSEGVDDDTLRAPFGIGSAEIARSTYPMYDADGELVIGYGQSFHFRIFDKRGKLRFDMSDFELQKLARKEPDIDRDILSRLHTRAKHYVGQADGFLTDMLKATKRES